MCNTLWAVCAPSAFACHWSRSWWKSIDSYQQIILDMWTSPHSSSCKQKHCSVRYFLSTHNRSCSRSLMSQRWSHPSLTLLGIGLRGHSFLSPNYVFVHLQPAVWNRLKSDWLPVQQSVNNYSCQGDDLIGLMNYPTWCFNSPLAPFHFIAFSSIQCKHAVNMIKIADVFLYWLVKWWATPINW